VESYRKLQKEFTENKDMFDDKIIAVIQEEKAKCDRKLNRLTQEHESQVKHSYDLRNKEEAGRLQEKEEAFAEAKRDYEREIHKLQRHVHDLEAELHK
jgi:hypothetical protein